MRRLAIMCGFTLCVASAAGAESICDGKDDWYVPFVACIELTGEFFRGCSQGRTEGLLRAESSRGAICQGGWRRIPAGTGEAEIVCDDGRSATLDYTYFERATGTAVGEGALSDGNTVKFCAGRNLAGYFAQTDPEDVQCMTCQPEDLLS